jgi:hypothetical protein
MKKVFIIIIGTLLCIIITSSCKKESPEVKTKTDPRNKFVGTWSAHLYFSRIGQEFYTIDIITKSTSDSTQIIFTEQGSSSVPRTATVSDSSYVFQDFTSTTGISGNYSGEGSMKGIEIKESGKINSDNPPYPGDLGDWYRTLTKP